ncbi:DUF72 domain-containing protein [Schleiferilactobacillus harbinensis]|jgi:uncharacterized protein YecE (DUF72 family)|uniref:DUF72 domain-containing protein n=1 Tax=Schleiferilactobacillus harbinensis TaxID=304207 RepID=UPI00243033DF|nr:DUF72 domain-containing protein [Schleiferilactobacillus harbinensis]MCI1688149.1 DUF72 domain-containing protein [Schleiferilactobacillus harbinensis]MCI1851153.1 DUF72 domain-containing protein [Schleiferilactobacillus harbinensis]
MAITIGLTTWTEHPSLLGGTKKLTLSEYAGFFPVVEVDTAFYAIPKPLVVHNWRLQVPASFQFIVKANGIITKHERVTEFDLPATVNAFRAAFQELHDHGQLQAVLLQFPPFFTVSRENILYLRQLRDLFGDWPLTVEWRNNTWYKPALVKESMLLLQELHMSLTIADEPATQGNSVPFYPAVTDQQQAFFRLHGRNLAGWQNPGAGWRRKRTLYRYNDQELHDIAAAVQKVAAQAQTTTIIFNNNAGGDAADNALMLQKILGLSFTDLNPRQLGLDI